MGMLVNLASKPARMVTIHFKAISGDVAVAYKVEACWEEMRNEQPSFLAS